MRVLNFFVLGEMLQELVIVLGGYALLVRHCLLPWWVPSFCWYCGEVVFLLGLVCFHGWLEDGAVSIEVTVFMASFVSEWYMLVIQGLQPVLILVF